MKTGQHEHEIAPGMPLSMDELARRTGEKPDRLIRWRKAGLIGRPDSGQFDPMDVGRARLVHDMLHYGHSLPEIAVAFQRPDSMLQHFFAMMSEMLSRTMHSLAEAAEMAGLPLDVARRVMDAAGVHEPGEMVDSADLECLRAAKVALDAGLPEEGLLQILRVYADAMSRAAEVGSRTSHFYMHQPAQRVGLPPDEVFKQLEASFSKIEPLIEPSLMYFYNKGAEHAMWDDLLMHLEEEAGLATEPSVPGEVRQCVMFVDLAGFTPLAEAMGDVIAADIVQRFGEIVRVASRRCHGRIVKQIGDAFMIVFSECYSAVSCALELEARTSAEPHFPAVRTGLHWGPILYREGDYLGSNVNIAARLVAEAASHQVLLTADVWQRARSLDGAEFTRLGKRHLKGLANEVEVFEARIGTVEEMERILDPVCRMELGAGEIAAQLTVDGREHAFCSDDCLKKFVVAPGQYIPA